MPGSRGRVPLDVATAAFAEQSEVVRRWADGLSDEALHRDTRIVGWSVRDVLAHLVISATRLSEAPVTAAPPRAPYEFVADYAGAAKRIAEGPAAVAGDPRAALASATEAALARLADPAAGAVVELPRGPIRLADAVATRVIELVVHGDDLDVVPATAALALTVRVLAGMVAARFPGRAVELRVPPYAAVQLLEGTVHRRGTPTAVVSVEPMTWVRLATGRVDWVGAAGSGALTASGERSDLSALLPVLR